MPQPADGVSLAPKITVADARVVWDRPDFAVDRQIRACTPAPGAWTTLREQRVKVGPVTRSTDSAPPGELRRRRPQPLDRGHGDVPRSNWRTSNPRANG